MDVQIVYEHVERELYNAFLIKFELEKRGYDVLITRWDELRFPSFNTPKLILMPWLFGDHNLDSLRKSYFKKFYKILNLQYEQVTSQLWLDIGYHVPCDKARNASILCWGNYRKQILLNEGISSDNIVVIGDIRQDFTKPEFKKFFKSKEELSNEFNIPLNHKWNLFVSSFSFINQEDEAKSYFEDLMGKKNYEKWCSCNIDSQRIIIDWIKQFLDENPNHEFIYRPHPSEVKETDFSRLAELDNIYSNFHFIFKYSVQDWILNSDYVNFWFSTSIVECYSLNKTCNILRPIKIDEYFDVPFYINANHIDNYETFCQRNLNNNQEFPIKHSDIEIFYNGIGNGEFVYKKLCDYIEKMLNENSFKKDFYNGNVIIDNIIFYLSRIWKGRIIEIMKNIFANKKDNEVKKISDVDNDKIILLKKIVEDNFN